MSNKESDKSYQALVSSFEQLCDRLRAFNAQPVVALCAAVVAVVWKLLGRAPADHDLFARIGMGRLVHSLAAVPLEDPFAFTAKLTEWIDHEWLSGVVFYQIVSKWGDIGLITLKLAVVVWTTTLLVRASCIYWPQVSGRVVWLTVCLLEAAHLWASTVRSQIFTYLIIALIYHAFSKYRAYGNLRALTLIPFVLLALVNMHGGYALAVVILWLLVSGSFLEGRPWRALAVVAVLSIFAPIATPYGFNKYVSYLLRALSMQRPTITEWEPLYYNFGDASRFVLIIGCMLLGVIVMTSSERIVWLKNRCSKSHLTALTIISFSIYCAVSHIRFVGFAMITAAVFGAGYWSAIVDLLFRRFPQRSVSFARMASLVGLATFCMMILQIVLISIRPDTWKLDTSSYPTTAIKWLRNSGLTGRLLVDFNNGSFALWRLYPRFRVSVDGRYEELYTEETVRDAALAMHPETPEGAAALSRIAPTHILFSHLSDSAAALAALSSPSQSSPWHEVYRDERYTILTLSDLNPEVRQEADRDASVPADGAEDLWRAMF